MRRDTKFVGIIIVLIALGVGNPCAADELTKARERTRSDDARTMKDVFFHAEARSLVIRSIEPNKLGVGGREFRVKRNPVGEGCFVYDPRTTFYGVKRLLVWWVPNENTAYALNSPSKMVTPSLKWPREDGLHEPTTGEIVAYVFENKPMTPAKPDPKASPSSADSFTVKEYTIYRELMDTPMSVSESQAKQNIAKRHEVNVAEVERTVDKVMLILSRNNWFGSPESEIQHAIDWEAKNP